MAAPKAITVLVTAATMARLTVFQMETVDLTGSTGS
jgi:hypothetical protein